MPRICVFRPSATSTQIINCKLHRHINREQADEREARGELIRFDASGKRFIESGGAHLDRTARIVPYPHPTLSRATIFAAAGGEPHAKALVDNSGAQIRPLEHVTVDDLDVYFNVARGKEVLVVLNRRREEAADECSRFLGRHPRSGTMKLSEIGKLRGIVAGLRQERRDAQQILREMWPKIFLQFTAACSEAEARLLWSLSVTPPEELPAALAFWTVRAYMREQ